MAAGEADLQRAPGLELAADLGEIRGPKPRGPLSLSASRSTVPAVAADRLDGPEPPEASATRSIRGGVTTARRLGRRRMISAASPSVATPTTSIPSTSDASATADAGTTIRRSPRSARAAVIGNTPGTGRTSPPSDSSPTSAIRPGPVRTCSDPSRIPSAIARSSDAPALRRSAGARLTVIRRGGWTKPALRIAPRTRSRASWSAVSARPTIVKPGRPGATSTSTRMTGRRGRRGLPIGGSPARPDPTGPAPPPADSPAASPAHRPAWGGAALRAPSGPLGPAACRRPGRSRASNVPAASRPS